MHPLNEAATEVLKKLTEGFSEESSYRKLDNRPGCYMAAVVERIGQTNSGDLISVAHYFEMNGDLCKDPEMIFLRGQDNKFYPTCFQQDVPPFYQEVVEFDSFRTPRTFDLEGQRKLAEFANTWMLNIQQQQNI